MTPLSKTFWHSACDEWGVQKKNFCRFGIGAQNNSKKRIMTEIMQTIDTEEKTTRTMITLETVPCDESRRQMFDAACSMLRLLDGSTVKQTASIHHTRKTPTPTPPGSPRKEGCTKPRHNSVSHLSRVECDDPRIWTVIATKLSKRTRSKSWCEQPTYTSVSPEFATILLSQ